MPILESRGLHLFVGLSLKIHMLRPLETYSFIKAVSSFTISGLSV